MTTPATESESRRWRSRAFVQPVLVTIVGVAGPPAIFLAVTWVSARLDPRCPSCDVGYGIGMAIIIGVILFGVWLVVMLAAGFVVGRSSADSWLALQAILAVVASVALTMSIIGTTTSPDPTSLLDVASIFLAFAAWTLVPTVLGYGVGRSLRPSRQSG